MHIQRAVPGLDARHVSMRDAESAHITHLRGAVRERDGLGGDGSPDGHVSEAGGGAQQELRLHDVYA